MGLWDSIFVPTPQPEVLVRGWVTGWHIDHGNPCWESPPRTYVEVKLGEFGGHMSVDVSPEMFQKIREQNENGGYSKIAIVLMEPKLPKEK